MTWQIKRVATIVRFRGQDYGRMLVNQVLVDARRLVMLHSQIQAIGFYERPGFEAYGPEFEDAEIQHRRMRITVAR